MTWTEFVADASAQFKDYIYAESTLESWRSSTMLARLRTLAYS